MKARVALLALAALLTACGGATAVPDQVPRAEPTPDSSRLSDGTPLLVADATILDSGRGAELCLGLVQTSLPPQCGGPKLRGWTWPSTGVERSSGVTWGEFAVVGTYAKDSFTVVKQISKAEAARSIPSPDLGDFTSLCPERRASDPARATQETREAVLGLAAELPGYAGAWIDDHGDELQNPETTTVNILVTGDPDQAEQRLRSVWGGPLCAATTQHSEAELKSVMEALTDRGDMLSAGLQVGAGGTWVSFSVVYDEGGAVQKALDQRYGVGTTVVSSALCPYLG